MDLALGVAFQRTCKHLLQKRVLCLPIPAKKVTSADSNQAGNMPRALRTALPEHLEVLALAIEQAPDDTAQTQVLEREPALL